MIRSVFLLQFSKILIKKEVAEYDEVGIVYFEVCELGHRWRIGHEKLEKRKQKNQKILANNKKQESSMLTKTNEINEVDGLSAFNKILGGGNSKLHIECLISKTKKH